MSYFYINHDIYDFSDYNKILSKSAEISISNLIGDNVYLGEKCKVMDKVQIEDSIICDNTELHENSSVIRSYIFRGSKIEKNCILEDCVVFE